MCAKAPHPIPAAGLQAALTIAGSDSGAHAGIQADLLTFADLGVFGTTAITCLTAQNPGGVSAIHPASADFVMKQVRQVNAFYPLAAVKTGMLYDEEIIAAVARFVAANPRLPTVVDPVMVATSGALLLKETAVDTLKEHLLPVAVLVTPNLDEVAVLLGEKPTDYESIIEAARLLATTYRTAFLVKGGHLEEAQLLDVFAQPNGEFMVMAARRATNVDTHGSGCTLSAAITALLARGFALEDAVEGGHAYLQRAIHRPLIMSGRCYINHRVG